MIWTIRTGIWNILRILWFISWDIVLEAHLSHKISQIKISTSEINLLLLLVLTQIITKNKILISKDIVWEPRKAFGHTNNPRIFQINLLLFSFLSLGKQMGPKEREKAKKEKSSGSEKTERKKYI